MASRHELGASNGRKGEGASQDRRFLSAVVFSGFDAIKWTSSERRERFEQLELTFTTTAPLELDPADWAKMFVMPGFEPFLESGTVNPSGERLRQRSRVS